MRLRTILLIIHFLLFFPLVTFAGTTYYVDLSAANGGNGSYSKPWNSIAQVNAYKFKSGDDLYFKVGSSKTVTQHLTIDWHGTANDRVIIGAYYGKGKFGLNGNERPLLNGNKTVPSNMEHGLVQYVGPGHITIQDLHIKNSYGGGIVVKELWDRVLKKHKKSTDNIVKNCKVVDSGRQGILLCRSSNSLIEGNFVDGSSQTKELLPTGKWSHSGGGIEVTGMSSEDVALNNIVRGNTVRRSSESISAYKGARYTTIENNTVYDVSGNGIYAANARDGIIRNNVVYGIDVKESRNPYQPWSGRRQLIWIDSEGHVDKIIKVTGGWKIYDNFLAGGRVGIWLQSNSDNVGVYQKNNKIYNNRIVDCDRNIWIQGATEGWSGNEIYNNYSFIFTPGLSHIYGSTSPPGVAWEGNHYNSKVTGNAAYKAKFNGKTLIKKTGWRNLPYGTVTSQMFNFVGEGESEGQLLPVSLEKVKNVTVTIIN
jgi:parallel beta-helix repeat protein